MQISYKNAQEAWENYHPFLLDLIVKHKFKKICEIGGGANPAIKQAFIEEHGIEYTILDISEEELAKAPQGYIKVLADITSDEVNSLEGGYDFMFSKMLAEHIADARKFHENVKTLLRPGGMVFHFTPTLYCPPFLINKFLPEKLSYKILTYIYKERHNAGRYGKFPAYYDMCYGPTKKQLRFFAGIGYKVHEYIGFFGHGYYRKIPPLKFLSDLVAGVLIKFPVSFLTSYSYLLLVKE